MYNTEKKIGKIERKYIIPNSITASNMFMGFLSIIMSSNGNYKMAAAFVILAIICDGLDGKTARKLDAFSEFGKEFDSFCDAISFGMAPSILIYSILRDSSPIKEVVLPISFLFALCGVLRLVKFNIVTVASKEKDDFCGMPIPTAAGLICSYFILSDTLFGKIVHINFFTLMVLAVSLLMVSNVTFKSLGKTFSFIPKKLQLPLGILILATYNYSLFPFGFTYSSINILKYIYKKNNI